MSSRTRQAVIWLTHDADAPSAANEPRSETVVAERVCSGGKPG